MNSQKSRGRKSGAPKLTVAEPVGDVGATDHDPEADTPVAIVQPDGLAFLIEQMNDKTNSKALRVRAAVAVSQYQHLKKGDGGIKDAKKDAAGRAAQGKYAPAQGPRLATANGKPVA